MPADETRPSPEHFLSLIQRQQRGRLKIYLGFAAGVGKTYEMLQEGQRLKRRGVDVVVGVVETHGRPETAALLEGLEQVPRRRIEYRGVVLEELDLDAIVARRPTVCLVDELAHTNAPGSNNAKRYQDIEALLKAGINVVSTLNIQHLESLYDLVEKATKVKVK
jgi:two-component system sensor histidine kinase KdpD